MITKQTIIDAILAVITDARVEIDDPDNNMYHIEIRVVSQQFRGLSMLAQHKKVYACLNANILAHTHAISLHTTTPD